MKVYAISRKGVQKEICQDSVMVGNTILSEGFLEWEPEHKFVVAVADGVGGNPAGEEASFSSLKGLRDAKLYQGCTVSYLQDSLNAINASLVERAAANPQWERMATTLTGVYLDDRKALLFHVGNTRLFCQNGAYLRQMTNDHTNVNAWVSMGMMTRQEAKNHPRQNELNACLGGGTVRMADKLEVKEITDQIGTDKSLLLTSDGIHDYLSVDEMEQILAGEGSIRERLERILRQAQANGSTDDISLVYVDRNER
jgi:protein phosphatase